jgi:Spy/CpxP family protein refolding chaperone
MNKRLIWVLSAALLSGVSVAAIASNHGMDHQQHGHAMHDSGKGHEARMAQLERSLQIKDTQRSAWDAYAKQMNEMAQSQQKNRESMQAAQKALMAELSAEQQKTFQSAHAKHKGRERGDKKSSRDSCQH